MNKMLLFCVFVFGTLFPQISEAGKTIQDIEEDFRQYALAGYSFRCAVKDIEYAYSSLNNETFYSRQVKKFTLTVNPYKMRGNVLPAINYQIELTPGQRIADWIFLSSAHQDEGSFIFYQSDRSLNNVFKTIISAKPSFNDSGSLASVAFGGIFKSGQSGFYTREDLKYDLQGKLKEYTTWQKIPNPNSPPNMLMTSIDVMKLLRVEYDTNGRPGTIVYIPHVYGLSDTWRITGIRYNQDGDVMSWDVSKRSGT